MPRAKVRYLDGDDLWLGAEPGWYWFADGDDGDSVGPFPTRSDAVKDMDDDREGR